MTTPREALEVSNPKRRLRVDSLVILGDVSPFDFFLRGYLETKIHASKPNFAAELKDGNHRVIGEINPM